MDRDPEDTAQTTYRRRRAIVLAAGAILLAFGCVVFLVLTGIIAEPETVIESIVRAISGG